jgi:elongation factor G
MFFMVLYSQRTQGAVIGGLNTRRGTIIDSEVREDEFTATAEVALNDMFGYSNQLRGSTQGKGKYVTFS